MTSKDYLPKFVRRQQSEACHRYIILVE